MDKKEIVVLLLSSAVIGALFSSVITAIAQWRERVARQKELVLTISVELSKAYIERIVNLSNTFVAMPDLLLISLMHKMVQDLFEHGSVSDENRKDLTSLMKTINDSLKESREEEEGKKQSQ